MRQARVIPTARHAAPATTAGDPAAPAGRDAHIHREVTRAGAAMQDALGAMLDELAETGTRDQRTIQSALNLSQSATSRLVSGVRVSDPLATLARIPGPEGLRKMLKGATRAGVSRGCLDRVEAAIVGVERLIEAEMGDRYSLDALLSDWVHESRAGFEIRQKAAAYKAMSAIRGVQVQTINACWIIHPSNDPARHDTLQIDGLYGCRRVRPSAVLHMTNEHLGPLPAGARAETIDGRPVGGAGDVLLGDFSTVDPDSIETTPDANPSQIYLHGLPLGRDRGRDYVTATVTRGLHPAFRRPGGHAFTGVAANIEPACQDLVLDVLLGEGVWAGAQPELRIFDTVVRGMAHPEDPARRADRLDMLESIEFLGSGVRALRAAELPRQTELIEHVCARLGWNANGLRGFRCKIRYPVYGSQVCVAFPLAEPPV